MGRYVDRKRGERIIAERVGGVEAEKVRKGEISEYNESYTLTYRSIAFVLRRQYFG